MDVIDDTKPSDENETREWQTTESTAESPVPPALVREVASQLKSLPNVMTYEEYAAIVHRIAGLKWRCELRARSLDQSRHTDEWTPSVIEAAAPLLSR